MSYSPHGRAPAQVTTYAHVIHPSILGKRISVEKILVWAYRVEMVHLACPEGLDTALTREFSPGPVEWRIDRIEASAKYQFAASHDAYRVHEAVLRLSREPLIVPAWQPPAAGPDLARGALPERPALRTSSLHELVMTAALRGPPSACLAPEIQMRRGPVVYRSAHRRAVTDQLLCVVSFSGDLPWIVAQQRFVYSAWVDGLRQIRESLCGLLTAHRLSTDMPMRDPWVWA